MNTTILNYTDRSSDIDALNMKLTIPLTVLTTLIGWLAVIGNVLVMVLLRRHPNLLESTRKFCIHLAVTDMGNEFLTFAYSIVAFEMNVAGLCLFLTMFVKLFVFASQAIVTAITIERYIGICKRHFYTRFMKTRSVNIILLLAWSYAVALTSLSIIGHSNRDSLRFCHYHLMFKNWVYIVEGSMMFTFSAVNFVLFGFIMLKAREFHKRVSPAALQGTSNAAMIKKAMQKSIRNGRVMGLVTSAFLICWMPYNGFQIYFGIGKPVTNSLLSVANTMYLIGLCNSTMNPFIYVWQKKEFRDRFKSMFKCTQSQQGDVIDLINLQRFQGNASLIEQNKTNELHDGGDRTTRMDTQQTQVKKTLSFDDKDSISTIEID